MATVKTKGKSGFLKEFFVDHPAASKSEIDKAWQEAGNEGTISESLIHLVRTKLRLTGKGRVKAKAKQAVGTGKRTAAAKQPSAGTAVAKSVGRGQSTTTGKRATPGAELGAEPRPHSGNRTRTLIEFEHRIDDLLHDAREEADALKKAKPVTQRQAELRPAERRGTPRSPSETRIVGWFGRRGRPGTCERPEPQRAAARRPEVRVSAGDGEEVQGDHRIGAGNRIMTNRATDLVERLIHFVRSGIEPLPDDFFNSFKYTCTGNALTHPLVFGLLARFAWTVEGVTHVGLDVALNEGERVKFKPDVIGYTGNLAESGGLRPLFVLDYESPNSSDWRVISKDVDGYVSWRDHTASTAPYAIITTLPEESTWWECRWTHGDGYDRAFHDRRPEWAASPRRFWHGVYEPEFSARAMDNIFVLNIDGKSVTQVFPAVIKAVS